MHTKQRPKTDITAQSQLEPFSVSSRSSLGRPLISRASLRGMIKPMLVVLLLPDLGGHSMNRGV